MANRSLGPICPHLGLDDDRTLVSTMPASDHRCYLEQPPGSPALAHQEQYCLGGAFQTCPVFLRLTPAATAPAVPPPPAAPVDAPAAEPAPPAPDTSETAPAQPQPATPQAAATAPEPPPSPAPQPAAPTTRARPTPAMPADDELIHSDEAEAATRPTFWQRFGWLPPLLAALVILGLVGVGWVFFRDLSRPFATPDAPPIGGPPTVTGSIVAVADLPTQPPTPTPDASASPVVEQPAQAGPLPTSTPLTTPTPEPGGTVLTLQPGPGDTGWWVSAENRPRANIGDSFLYAGSFQGQVFTSMIRFSLARVARGAPIREGTLSLTGLRDEQLIPAEDATWLVQLVPESSIDELRTAEFLGVYGAPSSITLPILRTRDLAAGQTNSWQLERATLDWLEQQLLDGATSVYVRLQASSIEGDSFFAWDSGSGPGSEGNPPRLVLNVGPPPPTPPPLPTRPFLVATLTPTPENVLTVVSQAFVATSVATLIGTYTPVPFTIYTPTPRPTNIATAQAAADSEGLAPIVFHTPTPANAAEATSQALYATAVALTTGTFTPVPEDYVTPMVIMPSPPPADVYEAAARALTATAIASDPNYPTSTPLPYNAVIGIYVFATSTPDPLTLTPDPLENSATRVARAAIATAETLINGTPTPVPTLPWYAVVITPSPTPTPTEIPLVVSLDEVPDVTPTPTATATPSTLPPDLSGKILFKSNRLLPGQTDGDGGLYVLDPASGRVSLLTQEWAYAVARDANAVSPNGLLHAIVQPGYERALQIKILNLEFNTLHEITNLRGASYDPAFSPTGPTIAFVSTESGGDEIYTVSYNERWQGGEVSRLTFNTWEWDKHPTWSPDGRSIVFYSNRESGRRQLWIMDADGSNQRNLSNNEFEDWDPMWVR